MFDTLIPTSIPYPIRGAIIRAVRTAVAILVSGVSASIADGSIIQGFSFIPAAYTPVVIMLLSTTLVGVDKWLRERGLEAEANESVDAPLTDNISVVNVPSPVVNVSTDTPVDTEPVVETVPDISVTENAPKDEVLLDDENPTVFDDPVDDKV
jgi:hypothetical protein